MIVGIGVDMVSVRRIEQSLERFGDRFAGKVLSTGELPRFRDATLPAAFLAKRFAAKEAVAKALGTGMRHHCAQEVGRALRRTLRCGAAEGGQAGRRQHPRQHIR